MAYKLTKGTSIIRLADGASIPDDPRNRDRQEYLKWLAAGNVPLPVDPETPDQIQARLEAAVQRHLDAEAQKLGYDGVLSAATYAASDHPKFGKEGRAFLKWRDAVWDKCYAMLAEVQAGSRAIPTEEELLAELPALII